MFSIFLLNVDFSSKTCYCLVNKVNAFSGLYRFTECVVIKSRHPGRGRRPRRPAEESSPLPTCPSYVGAGHARPAAFPQALSCRTRPGRTCAAPTTLPAGLLVCAPAQTPPYFFSLSKNAVGAGLCSARGRLPCEKLSRKSVATSGRRAEQSPAPTNPQQRRYSYPGVR